METRLEGAELPVRRNILRGSLVVRGAGENFEVWQWDGKAWVKMAGPPNSIAALAGDGLGVEGTLALKVNVDDSTLDIDSDIVQIKDGGVVDAKIGNDEVHDHHLNPDVAGAGLVHPHVLKSVNIDPKKYSGFAFGFGITRLAMLKYGIHDIRLLHSAELDFLRQF